MRTAECLNVEFPPLGLLVSGGTLHPRIYDEPNWLQVAPLNLDLALVLKLDVYPKNLIKVLVKNDHISWT